VEEKVSKAQKYFNQIIWAQVVLSVQKRVHDAEIVIHASKQTFRAKAKAADLYAAIDLASDKIDAQLKKYKERLKQRHKNSPPVPALAAEAMGARPAKISIIKQVPMRPMSADAAAEEMERQGYAFWLYQDKDTGQVQVIYRRIDESFGLLQPVRKGNG
jgi:putative sigma-54 modulation protein